MMRWQRSDSRSHHPRLRAVRMARRAQHQARSQRRTTPTSTMWPTRQAYLTGLRTTASSTCHGGCRRRPSRRHRRSRQTVSTSDALSSPTALLPFTHASQLLTGLGQAHPSISFPQFMGKNPNLWKTLCEQYFQMFGIHNSFWVPMAALNFCIHLVAIHSEALI